MIGLDRRRMAAFFATAGALTLLALSGRELWPTRLVYNASASVPLGWYAIDEPHELQAGDVVMVRPPLAVARLLIERHYLGDGVPLLKQLAAGPGMTVCRHENRISVGGTPAAIARDADALGRPLPRWQGCRTLGGGDVFLLNSGAPGSFDGRYFGPSPARDILGKATPLWTW